MGLTGLRHDGLDDPVGVVEHPLLGSAHDPRAPFVSDRLPLRLGLASPGGHLGQITRVENRDRADQFSSGRVLDRDRVDGTAVGIGLLVLLNARHGSPPAPLDRVAARLLGVEPDRLDGGWIDRSVLGVRGQTLDRVHGVHPGRDLAEHGVLAVQPRRAVGGDDEEL